MRLDSMPESSLKRASEGATVQGLGAFRKGLALSAVTHLVVVVSCCVLGVNSSAVTRHRVAIFSVCATPHAQPTIEEACPEELVEVEASPDDLDVLTPDPLLELPAEPLPLVNDLAPALRETRPGITRSRFEAAPLLRVVSESEAQPTKLPEANCEKPRPAAVAVAIAPTPIESANRPPAYPRRAIRLGRQGTVVLRVIIDGLGVVTTCVVDRSSGCAILDEAAIRAVVMWRFRDGPGLVLLPIEFVLGDRH